MRPVAVASLLLVAATGTWTTILGRAATGLSGAAVVLTAVALWTATVAAVAGMLVARSRWARRLALGVTGGHGVIALLPAPDAWWAGAAVLTCGAAIAVGGPWLNGLIRQRPAAEGPPTRSVLIPLVLVAVAFVIGVLGGGGTAGATVGFSALVTAFWFVRTLPGALVAVRIVWPALALGLALPAGILVGPTALVGAVAVATLAWHESVRNSVHPLVERGSLVPIPPELAPRDVLDAADIDDRGRRR